MRALVCKLIGHRWVHVVAPMFGDGFLCARCRGLHFEPLVRR